MPSAPSQTAMPHFASIATPAKPGPEQIGTRILGYRAGQQERRAGPGNGLEG